MATLTETTRVYLTQLTGQIPRETDDWETVQAAAQAGTGQIFVEVPWQHGHEAPGRHQLVVQRVEGHEVVYFNPRHDPDLPAGTVLPANGPVPERTVAGEGLERMPVFQLKTLFLKGAGRALLP